MVTVNGMAYLRPAEVAEKVSHILQMNEDAVRQWGHRLEATRDERTLIETTREPRTGEILFSETSITRLIHDLSFSSGC